MTRFLTHLRSNAVAYVALFVALGGSSYAALRIPAHSVGNRQLKNHSVSADKLDRSSIAGYVRDWAKVSAQGKVVASRPRAHIVVWRNSGPVPGGTVQWSRTIPSDCSAFANADILPAGSLAYANAEVAARRKEQAGQVYVLTSSANAPVDIAVICPQP